MPAAADLSTPLRPRPTHRAHVRTVQAQLLDVHASIQALQGVQAQAQELQQAHLRLKQEQEVVVRARRILEEELLDERRCVRLQGLGKARGRVAAV